MEKLKKAGLLISICYLLTLVSLLYTFSNRDLLGVFVYLGSWMIYSAVAVSISRWLTEDQVDRLSKASISILRWNAFLFEVIFIGLIFYNDTMIGVLIIGIYLICGIILNPFCFRKITPVILRSKNTPSAGAKKRDP